ncbi:Hypothetical predicted protein [Mytilus galloprovincialis]|uniref:Reverse transcriptase domain-containing protein n=1 Tax=Mytilus galloprovincialis TaxID=29158 RepID=A0A8B6H3B6_MYTGA|nr:Hypothetical predicted protein [Mytilus galloprovincialis]
MKENRSVSEIAKLRREQRNLTKCFKTAELYEQRALKELRDVNRERIQTMRKAEVISTLKKARAASAPGPNGIPYRVYKNCPNLAKQLWRLIKVIWRRYRLPDEWLKSDGCFIPQEEDSKQFRTISLLNVEVKVCLAILAKRGTTYMLENNYIDTLDQKGEVPGVPGCLEHKSVLTKIIQEAKENKGDLTVLWLDLENAYGSIPHKLVDFILEKYHIPGKITCREMQHYFNNFIVRFPVADYTTAW